MTQTEQVGAKRVMSGPFDIEMRVTRITDGGFPNNSANPFETRLVSLKHRDKPVVIQDKGYTSMRSSRH